MNCFSSRCKSPGSRVYRRVCTLVPCHDGSGGLSQRITERSLKKSAQEGRAGERLKQLTSPPSRTFSPASAFLFSRQKYRSVMIKMMPIIAQHTIQAIKPGIYSGELCINVSISSCSDGEGELTLEAGKWYLQRYHRYHLRLPSLRCRMLESTVRGCCWLGSS